MQHWCVCVCVVGRAVCGVGCTSKHWDWAPVTGTSSLWGKCACACINTVCVCVCGCKLEMSDGYSQLSCAGRRGRLVPAPDISADHRRYAANHFHLTWMAILCVTYFHAFVCHEKSPCFITLNRRGTVASGPLLTQRTCLRGCFLTHPC